MGAPYIIPFNNQPVNTVPKSNAGYTVPAGKYARITATLSASISLASTNLRDAAGSASANSTTATFWVKAGDVIATSGSNGAGGTGAINTVATASISLNGTNIAAVSARASGSTDTGTASIYVSGSSFDVSYIVEEYNQIS